MYIQHLLSAISVPRIKVFNNSALLVCVHYRTVSNVRYRTYCTILNIGLLQGLYSELESFGFFKTREFGRVGIK